MKWHPFDVSKTSKRQSKPEPTKRMLDENSSSSTTTRSAQKEDWLTKATDALIFQNQQDKERFLSRLASTSSTLSNNGEEETTITIGPHYLIDDSNSGGESSSSNSTKSVMPFIPVEFLYHSCRYTLGVVYLLCSHFTRP